MKYLFITILLLYGCSTYGSRYRAKVAILNESLAKNEITKAEYLQLKEQAEQTMYQDKISRRIAISQ